MAKFRRTSFLNCALALWFAAFTSSVKADNVAEEKFHDVFVTAGYSTAFGAALGAAMLAFKENPSQNLRFITLGASIGFITGSALGSYLALSPTFASEETDPAYLALDPNSKAGQLIVQPEFSRDGFKTLQMGWMIARF
jgi:hypothetical protein